MKEIIFVRAEVIMRQGEIVTVKILNGFGEPDVQVLDRDGRIATAESSEEAGI